MSNKHTFKDSSSIAHCDYNDDEKVLKIKFHSSDKEHEYPGCPKDIYEGLKAAESPGKFFHTKIRNSFKAR
jgi:uncharacterized protein YihD (DUF1040 family)